MNDSSQATTAGTSHPVLDEVVSTTRYWWLLLSFVAAGNEVMVGAVSSKGWRILHWLLAVLFVVVGCFAFFRPEDTFVALAAVMSFYFVFRGVFDIAMALAGSRAPGWWLLLIVGLAELAIGFWAAGSWKVSVVVLVSWVAAGALLHGIGQIASAFVVRKVGRDVAAVER